MTTMINSIIDPIVNPPTKSPITVTQEPQRDDSIPINVATWQGTQNVQLTQKGKPKVTDPNDAIVRITTTTICGSDLHLYYNKVPGALVMQKGDVLGHEFMGYVESVGPGIKNFKAGDRVVVSCVIACGICRYCKDKCFSCCDTTNPSGQMEKSMGHRTAALFGYSHLTGAYDGGQAEYVRVPFADLNCLKVPDSFSDEKALFLSDIVCTAWHGCELGEVSKGQVVAIWGAGPVGLLCAQWCKVRGASKVIVIDNVIPRLDLAARLGAHVINFSSVSSVTEEIAKLIPGGPDVCIDCAGFRFPTSLSHKVQIALHLETDALDIVNEMIYSVRKAGKVVLIGDYFMYGNSFPIGQFMEKGLTMRGGQVFVQKYWHDLLGYIERGEFDPTVVITHTMPFEKVSEAYDMFANKKDNCIKVLLKTKYATIPQTGA